MNEPAADPQRTTLYELAGLFLRLGATAFGGPAAHIAMMLDEVVRRRRWLDEQRFLDLLGATQLIPGPNSTEMALHIGWERRRGAGLLVAGAAFILPAMLITGACAWVYQRFGRLPSGSAVLYGVKPVIVAVVIQAIWSLWPKAARTTPLRWLGGAAALAAALGVNELLLLFSAGVAAVLIQRPARADSGTGSGTGSDAASGQTTVRHVVPLPLLGTAGVVATSAAVTLPSLFWVFLKIGSVLFGSGYVLIAFLRTDLVERLGWLDEAQLIDAVAIGQITPGPVFTTATFIGYVLAGPSGALVATLGIFLPAFVFVALSGPLVPRLRASKTAAAALDGVNVASLALMVVVTLQIARTAIVDGWTLLLAILSALALLRFKPNSTYLVLGGAAAGLALHAFGAAP
jgi:chromate transporter